MHRPRIGNDAVCYIVRAIGRQSQPQLTFCFYEVAHPPSELKLRRATISDEGGGLGAPRRKARKLPTAAAVSHFLQGTILQIVNFILRDLSLSFNLLRHRLNLVKMRSP